MTGANLFLFAAPRAGSSQLAAWLDSHPDIALPGVKEPNHFSAPDFPPAYVQGTHLNDMDPAAYLSLHHRPRMQFAVFRDPAHYAQLYQPLHSRWRLDASTSYLANDTAARRAAQSMPGARAITLTRDPLDRALSHYRLALRTGRVTGSLAHELDKEHAGQMPPGACYLIRPSLQSPQVDRVSRAFGDRCLHLQFTDLIERPRETLAQIAAFLDVDPDGFDLSRHARNAGDQPRWPALNAWLYRSGLKTRLRRTLPAVAKPMLKRVAFSAKQVHIPTEDIRRLDAALKQAARKDMAA